MARILSGIQPSGNLHLGNYFGMMRRMVEYQNKDELFCFIVDYHALTTQRDPKLLREKSIEAAADFLALGLEPNNCVFWLQSDLPEVTELTWILSNVTNLGLLERCHSYKDKISSGIKPNLGLFSYPVLMTADILIMNAEKIPVGKDQKQHIEVAADIAEKFNHMYQEVFIIPEPDMVEETQLVPGIDGRKMSKSYDNTIPLFLPKNDLKKRIMSIKTDSTPVDEPKPVENNPLLDIYSLFMNDDQKKELRERFLLPGLKYGDIKKELLEEVWSFFEPFRESREKWLKSPDNIKDILKMGSEKARQVAAPIMNSVREAVGLR